MAWRIERNPRGDGYVLRDSESGEYYGQRGDGSYMTFGSEREAQDAQEREAAWAAEERDRAGGGEGGQLEETIADEQERRASSADPEDQRERMDRGESRSGGYRDPYADDYQYEASDFEETWEDIPILGDGTRADLEARRQQSEADRARSVWEGLDDRMPSPDDIAVEYGTLGASNVAGAEGDPYAVEAEQRAMERLRNVYESGGLTSADRARMSLGETEMGRAMRSQRDADLSALQARGMGGSGTSIASMLDAQQTGADVFARREQEMQVAAQQRADQALARYGDSASRRRGQAFQEDVTRREAADERDVWNTGQGDRTRESRSRARQQAYENKERQAAGMTNQWQAAAAGARSDAAAADAASQRQAVAAGTLLDELGDLL